MGKYRSEVLKQCDAWLGFNEADGSHKQIIDLYNSHKPWARGYKLPYDVAWCSGFVSAVAIKLGYTDIIPTEVGCAPVSTGRSHPVPGIASSFRLVKSIPVWQS